MLLAVALQYVAASGVGPFLYTKFLVYATAAAQSYAGDSGRWSR